MKVYVDTSVVLRRLLGQAGRVEHWGDWELAVTSELTRVAARRTLDRLRLRGRLRDADVARAAVGLQAMLRPFDTISIQTAVLERAAAPFPTVLGTLDAIHLASALLWTEQRRQPLTFLTHDEELAIAAQASGLEVGPPA